MERVFPKESCSAGAKLVRSNQIISTIPAEKKGESRCVIGSWLSFTGILSHVIRPHVWSCNQVLECDGYEAVIIFVSADPFMPSQDLRHRCHCPALARRYILLLPPAELWREPTQY